MSRNALAGEVPDSQLEYLVVTEPIPCGCSVAADSVQGGFERFEISPGEITFYVGSRRHGGSIRYDLVGYLPGAYRAGPTVVRNAYRPGELIASAAKSLAVLPLGAESKDEYRLTPRELFELASSVRRRPDGARQKHLESSQAKWNCAGDGGRP